MVDVLQKNTPSTIEAPGGQNKTSVSLSTNIIIYVNGKAVGAVQSLKIGEKRSIKMIDELGTDGHIDSAPIKSAEVTGSCERVRFDRLRIAEAFGRGFVHVKSQRYPFDIKIIDKSKADESNWVTTTIKNVWITGIDYTYSADNWIISDTMTWEAETIYSVIGNGDPVAKGGEIGQQYYINRAEQASDKGIRRGAMDVSGLIDLLTSDESTGQVF